MFIYVIEGPAGSGKSTLLDAKLAEWPGAWHIDARATHRREYGGLGGLTAATVKDLSILGQIATHDEGDLILIDRWILSTLVYDGLRGEGIGLNEGTFRETMKTWVLLLRALQQNFLYRGRKESIPPVQINWKFNMPPEIALMKRRMNTGRGFPYGGFQELQGYSLMYQMMEEFIPYFNNLPGGVEMTIEDVSEGAWEW